PSLFPYTTLFRSIQLGRPQQVHYSGQMPPRNHPTTPTVFPLPLGRGLGRGPQFPDYTASSNGLDSPALSPGPSPQQGEGSHNTLARKNSRPLLRLYTTPESSENTYSFPL